MAAQGLKDAVIFEATQIGAYLKMSAIDERTGTEVSVMGPANAPLAPMRALALKKLERALRSPPSD